MYSIDKFVYDRKAYELIVKKEVGEVVGYYSLVNKYIDIYWKRKLTAKEDYPEYGRIKQFLNWLEEQGVDVEESLLDLTFENYHDFLTYYCDKGLSEQSRRAMHDVLCRLFTRTKEPNQLEWDNMYAKISAALSYEHAYDNNSDIIVYRDCPEFFVKLLLDMARKSDFTLFTIMKMGKCTGMRPAECLNVRMLNSFYGDGYNFDIDRDGCPKWLDFDISKPAISRRLRSDKKRVGGIKKPRTVHVFDKANRQELWTVMNEYLLYTTDSKREKYGPFFVNKNLSNETGFNMAYSYANYIKHFHELVENVIPELHKRGGEEAAFAEILSSYHYGPHMLREYFTCRMVEAGYNWPEIMEARGDKSPQTAVLYLIKGGMFKRVTIKNANKIGEEIMTEENITKDEFIKMYV